MFGMTVNTTNRMQAVKAAADKATFRNIGHASASVAKGARSTIKRAPKEQRISGKSRGGQKVRRARHAASPVGAPPFTQRGILGRAIVYAVSDDKKSSVIGATANLVGQSASAHELGGSYKGQSYPKRPFMLPELLRDTPRLAGLWRGSIGE